MPIIKDSKEAKKIFDGARERNVCLVAFATENQHTTEAILRATHEIGKEYKIKNPPVIITFPVTYPYRPQAVHYTITRNALLGFRAIMDDIEILVSEDSAYKDVQLMIGLDHGQPDTDKEILEKELEKLALVMYDCSHMPFEENIERTAKFVEKTKDKVLVEGAVDEIYEARKSRIRSGLTPVERAERFAKETGVYLIVPNLGTEHRSTKSKLHYSSRRAREISRKVGRKLVLHGVSSLNTHYLKNLSNDGIVKANIWTVLERVGGEILAMETVRQLGNLLNKEQIKDLSQKGFLGQRYFQKDYIDKVCRGEIGPKLLHITEKARTEIWIRPVIEKIKFYLKTLGYERLS